PPRAAAPVVPGVKSAPAPRAEPAMPETPDLVGSWAAYQRLLEGGIGSASLAELIAGVQSAPAAPAPGSPLAAAAAPAAVDVRAVDPLLLVLTVALATLTFPIRLIRWRVILRDERERPLPWLPLWYAVAIGFMANNLLPARAGEFARAYVASRQLPVRFTTAL